MNNKSIQLIISYIFSLAIMVMSYYFTYQIIMSVIIGIISFILIKFYVLKKLNIANKFKDSINEFSHLANSLIMQLTVTPNVSMSFKEICSFLDDKQKDILLNDELLIKERLDSIEKYYNFPLYQVFKEIIVLYDTQGGNIIDMSLELLNQIDNYIKNINVLSLDNNKKIGEVLVLWTFSLVALFYIKNILFDYYEEIILIPSFQYIVFVFFGLLIFSIYIMAKNYIEVKVGE